MTFDVLLDQAGGWGRFQTLQMVILFISNIFSYSHVLLENFTAAIPEHRCWVHLIDNGTTSDHNDTGMLSQEALLRVSIPLDSNWKPEKCRRFVHPQWQLLHLNETFSNITEAETEPCVDGWVYDQSLFLSTIVSKWDMVCKFQSLKYVAQSIFMVGSMLGSLVFGYIGDRLGRKVIYTWCVLQLAIADTCAVFAPTFFIYCTLRFLAGFACTASFIICHCLMIEWTMSQSMPMSLSVLMSAYNLAQIFLGGMAFFIRNWRTLQLTVSIPLFVIVIASRRLPESTRWLIATNQLDKGLQELKRVARINGKQNVEEILTTEFVKNTMQSDLDKTRIKGSISQFLHSPELLRRAFLIGITRMAVTVPFFALVLNLQDLGSNIFLFQVLFGVAMLLARGAGNLTMKCLGRRESQMLFFFLTGLPILVNTFLSPELQTLRVALATLGISGISACSTVISIHSNELIPTTFRSIMGGLNTVLNRLAGLLPPLLMLLKEFSPRLPWVICGVFPMLVGFAVFLLPETRNKKHPDTIQDMENDMSDSRKVKQEDTSMKVTQF